MKITRLYAPWDDYFGPAMAKKYGFEDYKPSDRFQRREPCVFFGCYGVGTKNDIMRHEGLAVIVWSGSDSTRLHEYGQFIVHCKQFEHRIFHIAHSHWIQTDLKHFNLRYIDKVVLPISLEMFKFEPNIGNSVYHYGSRQREWFYGTHLIKRIADRWNKNKNYPNVVITSAGAYRKEELYEIYKDSFVGVRLTEHDNMALSCIELGLMGRPSIFNGNIPCAIPYSENPYLTYTPMTRKQWVFQDESLADKIGHMILDLEREPSKELAEEMREFVSDNEDWLDTKFYDNSGNPS